MVVKRATFASSKKKVNLIFICRTGVVIGTDGRGRVLYRAKHSSSIEATSEMEYLKGLQPLRVAVVRDHLC